MSLTHAVSALVASTPSPSPPLRIPAELVEQFHRLLPAGVAFAIVSVAFWVFFAIAGAAARSGSPRGTAPSSGRSRIGRFGRRNTHPTNHS